MRGKRAKQLRKIAQDNTVGQPAKQYGMWFKMNWHAFKEPPKQAPYGQRGKMRMQSTHFKDSGNLSIEHAAGCTRAEYQRLKREYARSRHAH